MRRDGDTPLLGDSSSALGVRCPGDVTPDDAGLAGPGQGLSVAPGWRSLPFTMIPARLRHKLPKARGPNSSHCWRHGTGDFRDGQVAPDLNLRVTSPVHGLVEPASPMPLSDYRRAIADTRSDWTIDEQ